MAQCDITDAIDLAKLTPRWQRQASDSTAETCSTAVSEPLELPEELSTQESESDDEDCSRLVLSLRRLVVKDAKFCPKVPIDEEEQEDDEDVTRIRTAVHRLVMQGARRVPPCAAGSLQQ